MRARRITANLKVADVGTAKSFYSDFLGLSTEEFNMGGSLATPLPTPARTYSSSRTTPLQPRTRSSQSTRTTSTAPTKRPAGSATKSCTP